MASMEEKNKRLVLEAFDTLFNKRDYEAAARYWAPNYIQHSDGQCEQKLRTSQGSRHLWW